MARSQGLMTPLLGIVREAKSSTAAIRWDHARRPARLMPARMLSRSQLQATYIL